MGSSSSTLETAKLVRTLLSVEAASPEPLTQLLNTVMTEEETAAAFPVEYIRQLRHFYTHNFAALLYRCVGAVAAVAVKRHEVNTTTGSPNALLTAEVVAQYQSALRILRCTLPVALEAGTTLVEEPIAAAVAADTSPPSSDPAPAEGADAVEAATPPPPPSPQRTSATARFQQLFFVEGRTCNDAAPEEVFPLLPRQNVHLSPAQPYAKPLSLGSFLVWSLVECCFVRGLTLPDYPVLPQTPSISITHAEVDTGLMWCPGIGSEDPIEALTINASVPSFSWAAPRLPRLRGSLLDVLFVALSSPVYNDPGFRDTIFLEPLLSTSTVPLMPTLSMSLLNTVLRFVPYGYLPYSSHLGVEEKELVVMSARLLNATLCYMGVPLDPVTVPEVHQPAANGTGPSAGQQAAAHSRGARADDEASAGAEAGEGTNGPEPSTFVHADADQPINSPRAASSRSGGLSNIVLSAPPHSRSEGSASVSPSLSHRGPPRFVHSVRKMLRDVTLTEAKALVQRMKAILSVNVYSSQTYLPVSQDWFSTLDEFMVLFWKVLDLSPACLAQFGTSPHALDYVIPILDYALAVRRSPLYTYQFQLMLFVLTRLSEVRGFVLQCNQVCTSTLPFRFPKMSPTRTYNDLITLSLCLVMEMKDLQALVPLFPSCSVVLANMAPFITTLGREPSIKLVSVFAHAAFYCLRNGISRTSSSATTGETAAAAGGAPATPETANGTVHQSQMVNMCEAIASLLQYQAAGSLYLLASLVDHRAVVREAKDAYVVQRTRVLTIGLPLPFLINTLDAAVAVALPVVESTDALRRISKYYVDTTSAATVNNVTAALESTRTFAPPVGMGEAGAGLAASDQAVDRLRSVTLVGVLPTPHSIIVRKFQSTRNIEQWTTTTFWTSAYIHSRIGLLGDRDSVRLVQFA
ncbi:High-temperature-induced dauer-formation protein/Dyggve-Melchior-Clausen syndrome protein [Novymonas esmeraldas]|uniref:High-temperature-induced dauer-formation protein/Dyggve-Melchior-Clausen syndrome protein n=1 Tax=Novymonas esmeraldas TaxID=1808958 RepID=A0AAW0EPZ0_9TRYP